MTSLELFQTSNAWDQRYDLPLCPGLDNPWIYGAYALKLLRENGLSAFDDLKLVERFIEHARNCRVDANVPGLMNRWPDGSGGFTSHDELMGMAYISTELAKEVFDYLESTDGVYCNKEQDKSDFPDWKLRFNVYRMVWFRPFLKARAHQDLNFVSQLVFAGQLLLDVWKTKDMQQAMFDQGGRLRIWIMLEAMDKFSIAGAAVAFWRSRMAKLGVSPKDMLRLEPRECPVFCALGGKEF